MANADQADLDQDGKGDVCDADIDGDGGRQRRRKRRKARRQTRPIPMATAFWMAWDALPLDASESSDRDGDGTGDNADAFPDDSAETQDSDGDGVGDVRDAFPMTTPMNLKIPMAMGWAMSRIPDDDGDGFSDAQELADGTNPKSRFSCPSCPFSFDVDDSQAAQPLTDGLLVIRHLFGFSWRRPDRGRCCWFGGPSEPQRTLQAI